MKCLSCNTSLTNEESGLVFEHGEHIDLCKSCLDTTDIQPYQGNIEQLLNEREYHEEY